MTDHLFDPTLYGPGRAEHPKRSEPDLRTVVNGGQWYLLTRVNRPPLEVAHKIDRFNANAFGAAITRCGLAGNAIDIEKGLAVRPCGTCERK